MVDTDAGEESKTKDSHKNMDYQPLRAVSQASTKTIYNLNTEHRTGKKHTNEEKWEMRKLCLTLMRLLSLKLC